MQALPIRPKPPISLQPGQSVEVRDEEMELEMAHYELELTPEWRQKLLRTVQRLKSKRRNCSNQKSKKYDKASKSKSSTGKSPNSALPLLAEGEAIAVTTNKTRITSLAAMSMQSCEDIYGQELGAELQEIEAGLQSRFDQAVRHRMPVEWPATPLAAASMA
jgi:hypothetical protein